MPTFAYQARDKSGQRVSGTREAPDQRAALEALRDLGFYVTQLSADGKTLQSPVTDVRRTPSTASPVEAPPFAPKAEVSRPATERVTSAPATRARISSPWLRANSKQMSLFYRQMYAMINAGVGMAHALTTISQTSPHGAVRNACHDMSQRTGEGVPWSETMRSYPGLFPELAIGMVQAGETGGYLDRMCLRLSEYCERDYEIQQIIKRETWYPKLLLFCAIFIPSVVPLVLGGVGAWLQAIIPPLTVIGTVWVLWKLANYFLPLTFRKGSPRYWLDWLKLHIPVVGKTVHALATAKFCRAMSTLYGAGVAPHKTIAIAANACGNAVIAESVRRIIPKLEHGETLTEALTSTRQFPAIVPQMLSAGENSGNIDEQLEKVASFLETDAETTIRQALPALGIITFLAVALYIASIIFAGFGAHMQQINDLVNEAN